MEIILNMFSFRAKTYCFSFQYPSLWICADSLNFFNIVFSDIAFQFFIIIGTINRHTTIAHLFQIAINETLKTGVFALPFTVIISANDCIITFRFFASENFFDGEQNFMNSFG